MISDAQNQPQNQGATLAPPARAGERYRWIKIVSGLGCAAFVLGLASFVYSGYFSRYMADDYCDSVYVRFYSFWNGQVAAWQIMSGRFMVTFMADLTDSPFA
jgi:hypothetical protein